MEQERGRVRCRSDDETSFVVIAYQHVAHVSADGRERRYPGALGWATADGQAVRVIDDDIFQIVATGELLTRIDPGAAATTDCGP